MIDPTPITKDAPIGFIGLGWMGANFARRLVEAGWRLEVFDLLPEKSAVLADQGASVAMSADQVIRTCDVVFTSLPNSEIFEAVTRQTVAPWAQAQQVFVDLGTSRVGPTRELATALAARDAALLDAPVSGDPRTPVYMFIGGDANAFERVRPLLEVLADPQHLAYSGPSGAGQILKGVNQLSMSLVRAAWLEAVSYATRQGITPETIARAVGGAIGWRRELADVAGQIAEGKGELNDLKFAELPYFLNAAEQVGIELPLTRALFEFCDPGPRDWRDNMNRPYASFWYMLNRKENGEDAHEER